VNRPAVEFACLGLLAERPASGYDILMEIRGGSLRPFLTASQASVYGALRRLEQAGAVSTQVIIRSGRPDRTVYHRVSGTEDHFLKSAKGLVSSEKGDQATLLLFRFAKHVPCELLQAAVENARLALARELDACRSFSVEDGQGGIHPELVDIVRTALKSRSAQLHSLERLLRTVQG
jgi:hypothetical protein